MARDGNGNYTKAEADFVGGSVINATAMNSNFDDIAVALTNSIAKNGETKVTGDIDFNSNKAVNVKDATASADATNLKVIQNRVGVHGTSSGTNTITLTLSPAISGYIAGQEFTFKAGGTNTGATTININSKGAKGVKRPDGTALTAGMVTADKFYKIRYDGTSFILLDDIPINVLTEKTVLVDNDLALIEDSEASNARKKTKLSSVWNYIKGKFNSQSAFSVKPSANLENKTGDGTSYIVIFNSVISDVNDDYDNTTGEFTAPKDGLYHFDVNVRVSGLTSSHTSMRNSLVVSGQSKTIHYMNPWIANDNSQLSVGGSSFLMKMDAGDKAFVATTVSGGTMVVDVHNDSYFSGYLVREL